MKKQGQVICLGGKEKHLSGSEQGLETRKGKATAASQWDSFPFGELMELV